MKAEEGHVGAEAGRVKAEEWRAEAEEGRAGAGGKVGARRLPRLWP